MHLQPKYRRNASIRVHATWFTTQTGNIAVHSRSTKRMETSVAPLGFQHHAKHVATKYDCLRRGILYRSVSVLQEGSLPLHGYSVHGNTMLLYLY